jgi:glycosyltransferase involved in cell wall biosynthesis
LARERAEFGGLGLPKLAHWAERCAWRSADFVLPVTRVLANEVQSRGVDGARIAVIPNGINVAQFAAAPSAAMRSGRSAGTTRWCSASRASFASGTVSIGYCTGWLRARRRRTHGSSVVGDGPARPALEVLASALALGDRVRFTGVVARERVPELVAAFDIALQPAVVAYASPLKLFEYLALAKAIVAPRQPNIEEVLTTRKTPCCSMPATRMHSVAR